MGAIDREDDRRLILGLNATRAAGLRELSKILEHFGSMDPLRAATSRRRLSPLGLPEAVVEVLAAGEVLARGAAEERAAAAAGIEFVLATDPAFPQGLRDLANPPLVIYFRGRLPRDDERRIAIVGSRRATAHGERMARALAEGLAAAGIAVVSGLARGIDGAAHAATVRSQGVTFAVLGSGLRRIYPPEHRDLAAAITGTGGLLTEFGPDVPPLAAHFPRRNRVIAALSQALVLVEAGEKSGGLITVRWAADLGREVFAVPGLADDPRSAGVLALLRDGVRPIGSARDLLEDLGWEGGGNAAGTKKEEAALSREECRLLDRLDGEPRPIDAILCGFDMTVGRALTLLLALELRGIVEQGPGLEFRRRTESVQDPLQNEVDDGAEQDDGAAESQG